MRHDCPGGVGCESGFSSLAGGRLVVPRCASVPLAWTATVALIHACMMVMGWGVWGVSPSVWGRAPVSGAEPQCLGQSPSVWGRAPAGCGAEPCDRRVAAAYGDGSEWFWRALGRTSACSILVRQSDLRAAICTTS